MVRRTSVETKINHERWLVSYADFITLLFAFFVVMYSVSQVNESKYRTLSETLESAFSGIREVPEEKIQPEELSETAQLSEIASELDAVLSEVLSDENMTIRGNEQWLEVELNANLLFSSASDVLNDQARDVLTSVADVLSPFDNAVAIEGHTDDLPISNDRYQNNWELSSARAISVVSLLSYQGVHPERLSAVGYGEHRPVVLNDSVEARARNRRVVIKIAQNAVPAQTAPLEEYASTQAGTRAPVQEAPSASQALTEQPDTPASTPPDRTVVEGIEAVRLQGGGLLFSSDPDLPRTNPPLEEEQTALPTEE